MNNYQLIFDIKSDWHIGNGKEAGAYADALVLKDNNNLPYLPGKSIKGLLRHAFTTAAENNWFGADSQQLIEIIFGNENRAGLDAQGALQVSSAMLSLAEQTFLQNHKTASKHLYRVLQFTAIDHNSGVAKESSLRSMEVTIPMQLSAELNLNANHPAVKENADLNKKFSTYLQQVIPLITELGAKRHRGLGKVYVSVKTQEVISEGKMNKKKSKKKSKQGRKH